MKIYLLNMDKDTQRLAFMTAQLDAAGLAFERVPGVKASELDAEQATYAGAAIRAKLKPGEIGCLLAHISVWQKIADGPDDIALVMEDDVHTTKDFGDFIRALRLDADVIAIHRLETVLARVTLRDHVASQCLDRQAHELLTSHGGGAAYILNRPTAKAILALKDQFRNNIDIELFDSERGAAWHITTYQWLPAPCIQDMWIGSARSHGLASNIVERADIDTGHFGAVRPLDPLRRVLRPAYTWLQDLMLRPSGRRRKLIPFG